MQLLTDTRLWMIATLTLLKQVGGDDRVKLVKREAQTTRKTTNNKSEVDRDDRQAEERGWKEGKYLLRQ